mgnify:CR=1 FL=1
MGGEQPAIAGLSGGERDIFALLYHAVTHPLVLQVLGVRPSASSREVKDAYLKLAKKFHPDMQLARGISGEAAHRKAAANFRKIQGAYEM